jgi:alpha-tubulin suppressor-like RCC1 family protein
MVAALTMATAAPAHATLSLAKAWGSNVFGQLGNGTTTGPEKCGSEQSACSTSPVEVSNLSEVIASIAGGGGLGEGHSLALLESGKVMAWGSNNEGQLGNATTEGSDVPVAVNGLSEVTAIAAGGNFNLALLKNGKVMAWGSGFRGNLGNGTNEKSTVPVPVCAVGTAGPCPTGPYLEAVTALAAGGSGHALAVLSSGAVVAWGAGGQLGNGTTEGSNVPVRVCAGGPEGPCPTGPYLEGVTAVSASDAHSLALLGNGTAMAWGANFQGELGNATTTRSNVPVAVSGLTNISAIAAGGTGSNGGSPFSLALLGNGTVKAWGINTTGELGDGSSSGPEMCGTPPVEACSKKPVEVSALAGVTAIAARGDSMALLENGTVEAWGANGDGQLGNGTSTGPEACAPPLGSPTPCSRIPVGVSNLVDVKGIGAGDNHGLAFGRPPAVKTLGAKRGPASGGTTVTITGTDLTGATAVKFGSASASSFTVNSATSITAVSPAQVGGSVDVTVTTTWGTSAISAADRFKFVPTVTNLSPNTGSTAGGTSVTVSGAGFALGTTATKFRFGKTMATAVNCASTTACTVVAPGHQAATVDVKATVNKVSSTKSRPADQFTYN